MVLGLKTIEGIFEKLSEHFVINSSKCVRVRHKAAECTDCMDVCSEDAIKITSAGGKVLVDWTRCSDCGKCLTVCRNGVFSMRKADRERLFTSAASSINDSATVSLSCRQSPHAKAAAYSAGTLAFFNRKHMVRLVSMGANDIVLLKGDCDTCGKACAEIVSSEIDAARRIISICGNKTVINLVDRLESHPEKKEYKSSRALQENEKLTSRREFFGYLKSRTIESVGSTIHYLTENEDKNKKTVLTADSTATELEEYTNSLKMIGGDTLLQKMTDEGLLNEVHIDMEKCTLCGICSRMCPHGVFTVVTEMIKGREKAVDIQKDSLFCTGCGLCGISCSCNAISIWREHALTKTIPGSLSPDPDMKICITERITSDLSRCSENNKDCNYGLYAGETFTYCMHPDHRKFLIVSNKKHLHLLKYN